MAHKNNHTLASVTVEEIEELIGLGKAVLIKQKVGKGFPVTYVSNNAESVLGFEQDFFVGPDQEWLSQVHPEDREELVDTFQEVVKKGSTLIEFRFHIKDIGYTWLKGRTLLVKDEENRPQSILSYYSIVGKDLEFSQPGDAVMKPYEYVIARCSHLLLNNKPEAVNKTLSTLREFANADRAYIFENEWDKDGQLCASQKYEACAPGVTPQIDNPDLQGMPYSILPWWKKELSRNKIINEMSANMPDAERELMQGQGIKSVLIIPVYVDDDWKGFIGFDNVRKEQHWSPGEVRLLQMSAQIYGSYRGWVNSQELLEGSLREKKILLQEIHHRVKNNLAVISSLLQLQIYEFEDPQLRHALHESQSRVHSMALIHEKLYQSNNLTSIPFDSYVRDLIESISKSYAVDQDQVEVHLSINDVELNINTAIPFGLLLNEILTNSYQHAFPKSKGGNICVTLSSEKSIIKAEITDDGVGTEPRQMQKQGGLGMTLINALITQLNAEHQINTSNGVSHTIEFDVHSSKGGSATMLN